MDDYPNNFTYMSNEEPKSSKEPVYIIIIIILVLIGIGLGIWLAVRYIRDRNEKDRLVELDDPLITADPTSITGSWGKVGNSTDKVTLYVSEKPMQLNADGTVTPPCDQKTVICSHQTGSNNSTTVTTNISIDNSYNALLVVTGEDTSSVKSFPRKVFTQDTSTIIAAQSSTKPQLIQIKDLNTPSGAVSEEAGYTTTSDDIGTYRLGSAVPDANKISDSFLIKYINTEIPEGENSPTSIICREPGTSNLILGTWENHDDIGDPPSIVYKTPVGNQSINAKTSCQWNYSDKPPSGAKGTNQWCLKSAQQTSLTNISATENMCMARNGSSLGLINITTNTDTWFNSFISGTT